MSLADFQAPKPRGSLGHLNRTVRLHVSTSPFFSGDLVQVDSTHTESSGSSNQRKGPLRGRVALLVIRIDFETR
jgi:hypothetical protein